MPRDKIPPSPFPPSSSSSSSRLSRTGEGATLAVNLFCCRNSIHSRAVCTVCTGPCDNGNRVGGALVGLLSPSISSASFSSGAHAMLAFFSSSSLMSEETCLLSHLRWVDSARLAWSSVSTTLSLRPVCGTAAISEGEGNSGTIPIVSASTQLLGAFELALEVRPLSLADVQKNQYFITCNKNIITGHQELSSLPPLVHHEYTAEEAVDHAPLTAEVTLSAASVKARCVCFTTSSFSSAFSP